MDLSPNNLFQTGQQTGSQISGVLYIFAPRTINDQWRRPLAYQFDKTFLDGAVDTLFHRETKSALTSFLNNPIHSTCILPGPKNPEFVNLSRLSGNYTFCMCIDNDNVPISPLGIRSPLSQNRTIYTGFFLEEPVNSVIHGAHQTINPNAHLIITHKTLINKQTIQDNYGYSSVRTKTVADGDLLNPRLMSQLSNDAESVLMRPSDLMDYTENVGGGSYVTTIGDTLALKQVQEPITLQSEYVIPQENAKRILSTVHNAFEKAKLNQYGGRMHPDPSLTDDVMMSSIYQDLQSTSPLSRIGLKENDVVTIDFLVKRYGIQIPNVIQAENGRYAVANQSKINAENVLSAYLMNTVPAYLVEFKLSNVGFIYNSFDDKFNIPDEDTVGTLVPMALEEMRGCVFAFINALKTRVFPVIKAAHGSEFDLIGYFSCGNTSHCTLNFLDNSILNRDTYEVPTLMGGFNTPLVGSMSLARDNSIQLNTLINAMTDTADYQSVDDLAMSRQIQEQINYGKLLPSSTTPPSSIYSPEYKLFP
jgi:hypothetical protein